MQINRRAALRGLGAIALLGPSLARADTLKDEALMTVNALLGKAHMALRQQDDHTQLRAAIQEAFAFDVWERFLTQSRADAYSSQDLKRFRALLPGFLAHLYYEQFDKGMDNAPSVEDARAVRRDVIVRSTFSRTNGRPLPVDWRLRKLPGQGTRIIDIMVAGTSFLLLKRDEFNAILDRGGVEAVLTHMSNKAL